MRPGHENAIIADMARNEWTETARGSGERVVMLREAMGMTQAEFARRLGISYQRLSGWERETQSLPLVGAQLIRMKTGATLDWLYYGIEAGLPRDLADAIEKWRKENRSRA